MKPRSLSQNASLHVYLEQIAEALADSGEDMRVLVRFPVKPTKENVKEDLFKPLMNKMYPEIEHTSDLSTTQMQDVYEVFNQAMAIKKGISFDWPSYFREGK